MADPRSFVEEKILKALEAGPMTVSEVREIVFQRHRKVTEIKEALEKLNQESLVYESLRTGDDYAWHLGSVPPAEGAADAVSAVPPVSSGPESHEYTDSGWNIDIKKTTIQTLDELVDYCKIDLSVWAVRKCKITKWELAAIPRTVGSSGNWSRPSTEPIVVPLFSVRAELNKKENILEAKREIAALKEDAKKLIVPAPYINLIPREQTGNMLVISTPDLHIGKLAWSPETGWADYDSKIARQDGENAIAALMDRTGHYKYDSIAFIVGNDLYQADNKQQTTTRGTPVFGDSRYHKTFRMGRDMIAGQINLFRSFAPEVKVVVVPGNHDELTAWQLGDSLECLFDSAADVTVDNEPCSRKYLQHGTCMFMWCHGNEGKKPEYPLLMAVERPRMWAATTSRECHTGHLHTKALFEKNGILVRTLPSLCSADDWHSRMCFVGNQRSAEAYIYNDRMGHMGTAVYTIPEELK